MTRDRNKSGEPELRAARSAQGGIFAAAFVFSAFVNLLMLTGPIFMLQVYDRVLSSGSRETLTALFALVAFLFLMMGLLDHARSRLMARAAERFQTRLDARVFAACLKRATARPGDPLAQVAISDLDAMQRLYTSPVLLALFDMPWAPLFLAAIFLFHTELGILALCGGIVLIAITILNRWRTSEPLALASGAGAEAHRLGQGILGEAELVESLGMRGAGLARWQHLRSRALTATTRAADTGGAYATATKTLRLFLQSAMLALGAWLVLRGELSAGAMIASSILMGRALAPIEQAVGGWPVVARAREGWHRLAQLLATTPPETPRMALAKPLASLEVNQLSVVPPGKSLASLRGLSFKLEPGQAVGVIGPSGAGKSTLARAIAGTWPPSAGTIRLDGAKLERYDPDMLGVYIGYLPQRVTLLDGTIAENIARMAKVPDAKMVITAAELADAHRVILELPDGYDTRVSQSGGQLSGGQIQRIGLARALYGDPVILILDEPNSNLDNDGSQALNMAICAMKAKGRSALIMAHRPAAIAECDMLLVLEGGARRAFGPRDEILRATTRNATGIVRSVSPGAVT
jgi:ATP-binding cassette subfamily C protein